MPKKQILTLERYLPYRLSLLSNRVSGIIAGHYRNKFALSITEWRIMAVLGEYPDSSAEEVSQKTQIEKSILSRAISRLLQRKIIARKFSEQDRRRSMLRLTSTGLSVYNELVPVAYQHEQALVKTLTGNERLVLDRIIDKLYERATELDFEE